jgi:hypothetical protein
MPEMSPNSNINATEKHQTPEMSPNSNINATGEHQTLQMSPNGGISDNKKRRSCLLQIKLF